MIVPMKKITVLCLEPHRDETLTALRELGALHLEPVRETDHPSVEAARREFEHIRLASNVLPSHPHKPPSGRTPQKVVESLWVLIHERDELRDERVSLMHEIERVAPFGDFSPEQVHSLEARGIQVRLYQARPKTAPEIRGEQVIRVEGASDSSAIHFAVISRGACEVKEALEIRLPEIGLKALRNRLTAVEERLAAIEQDVAAFGGDHDRVAALRQDAEDAIHFAEARAGSGEAEASPIVYLRGYAPADAMDRFRESARTLGWGLRFEDPGDDDPVPTWVRTPRWARPIEVLMDFIGIMPGYREVDTSIAFLFFFGLFFAMLVGDAAYGAIFLGFSLWGRRRFPNAPRKIFGLLEIMAVGTIIWGSITGVFFGIHPKSWPLTVTWLESDENIKRLCFIIGVTHLTLAHVWNVIRMGLSLPSLAQVGWLGTTWTMFFFANKMVLGDAFPSVMMPVFIASVILIVLFMTPLRQFKAEWFNHAMLPLNLVSNFVDVVSYIRLFAVGAASFAIANNFNTMLAPMLGSWWTALFGALFLFLAHALNIVLSLMGVMVHGVRLNTLEFAGHIGLQWSGIPYRPFRRTARAAARDS